jgi:ferredoxin
MRQGMYDCTGLFNRITEEMPLYLPFRTETGVHFDLWRGDISAVDFDTLKTTLSPKGFFLPPSESLYTAVLKDNTYEITPRPLPNQPFALFGVRACDAAAVKILDDVFLGEPTDESYQARRDAVYIITLACAKPDATCFCHSLGIDPTNPGGDVSVWFDGDSVYWFPVTKKGEHLTDKMAETLGRIAFTIFIKPFNGNSSFKKNDVFIPQPNPDNPHEIFNAPVWDGLCQSCFACGTCTFLCPVCQCYDIVSCNRHWDACLYPGFTQMAHGNPRPTKKERFRQRFMHKLVYHKQKYGVCGCVGCGRCVSKCPVNMNIVKVAKTLCTNLSPTRHG